MSIESKHAYRFGYLKSEKWKIVRLETLLREKGCCQICDKEDISNDAHHIFYPKCIYDTTPEHLVILCRPCHDFIHAMTDCKTKDEEIGKKNWERFRSAIAQWRSHHMKLFSGGIPVMLIESMPQMRNALRAKQDEIDYLNRLRFFNQPALNS